MRTLTKKSASKEVTKLIPEDNSIGWLVYLTIGSNLATFLVVMVIAYIITMSGIYHYKHNLEATSQNTDELKWVAVNTSLDDIKLRLDELQKQTTEASTKDTNWQKMSRDYHVQLLFNIIKSKIISGDDYASEIAELDKFAIDERDANFQVIKTYLASNRLKVSELLANLYDEAANKHKPTEEKEGFINSIKHFFTNLFTIKKLDENKIHATSNEITSIIVQLLLDGRIQAAYIVASKFHGVDASITKIADALREPNDALAAVDKLNGIVND